MSRDDPALQPFRVQLVDFTATLAELRAVRDEVFVGEQRVPVELEHDAGDHTLVLARVTALRADHTGRPLLFFRGGFGGFAG